MPRAAATGKDPNRKGETPSTEVKPSEPELPGNRRSG